MIDDIVLEIEVIKKFIFQETREYRIKLKRGEFPQCELLPCKIFTEKSKAYLAKAVLLCLLEKDKKTAFAKWVVSINKIFAFLELPNWPNDNTK